MLARMLVGLWLLVYGKFHLRGSGFLIRFFYPFVPGLKAYPLEVPGVGTIPLDLRQNGSYGMLLRFKLGDPGTDVGLYRAIENFLRPGAVFWDVGAFAGYISAYFAHPRYQLASVQAFEPNPATLEGLRKLLKNSAVVTIHPFALGNAEQWMELSVPEASSMASLVRKEGTAPKVKIQVRRGDTARKELNIPMPDVIKIDVEGFEAEVIAGLAETIAAKRPVIFFEHIFLSDRQVQELVPPGYQLWFIGDNGQLSDRFSSRTEGHDAFLVPADNPLIRNLQRG